MLTNMKRETIKQAAERTGLSPKVLRNAALKGKITFLRNGEGPTAVMLLTREDVDRYLAGRMNARVLSPREYAQCARDAKGSA